MAWAIVYYSGVGSREPQCGNINSFHASVFLARQPMETGCPYPLNEDDPPVTRLVAMAPACHASQCPSLSPTFIRQHLPDNQNALILHKASSPWVRHGKETPSMIVSR